jgi:hypothetical protein
VTLATQILSCPNDSAARRHLAARADLLELQLQDEREHSALLESHIIAERHGSLRALWLVIAVMFVLGVFAWVKMHFSGGDVERPRVMA